MKLLRKNLAFILFYVMLGGKLFGQCPDAPGIQPTGPYGVNFCSGSSTGFRISNPVAGQTYQWQKNGSNIPGATGSSVSASEVATYRLIVYHGMCTYTTAGQTTNMWNTIAPTVPNVSGPAGMMTISVSNPDGISSYNWYNYSTGAWLASGTSYSPNVSVTTQYKVLKGNACGTSPQTTVTRTVTP